MGKKAERWNAWAAVIWLKQLDGNYIQQVLATSSTTVGSVVHHLKKGMGRNIVELNKRN